MSLANSRVTQSREPKITPLDQSRLQVERWFKIEGEAWAYSDKIRTELFGGFGLEDGTTATSFSQAVREHRGFANCRLIEEYAEEYISQSGARYHNLYQKYQTLLTTWANEIADKPSSSRNGLRLMQRVQVAAPGTAAPYDEDDVGELLLLKYDGGTAAFTAALTVTGDTSGATGVIDTIDGTTATGTLYLRTITGKFQNNEALTDSSTGAAVVNGKGLYLSEFDDDSDDMRGRFITKWAEDGIEKIGYRVETPGVRRASYRFLGREGTTVGPVMMRDIQDYEGFRTYVVETMQDISGNALASESVSYTVINQVTKPVTFNYPGTIQIDSDTLRAAASGVAEISLKMFNPIGPSSPKIDATIYTYFQTSGSVALTDNTNNRQAGVSGYWNPKSWVSSFVKGVGLNFAPMAQNRSLSGYALRNGGTASITGTQSTTPGDPMIFLDGVRQYATEGDAAITYTMALTGGPPDPEGSTFVIFRDVEPAFSDVEGNSYFKKTIIIATIPARTTHVETTPAP